ncbi:MAG: hypothetical protein COS34_05960 [Lysobacterales bacterium CG02_land_8_20_14_3_00_62_12]|nr:MAG: hypothetical protein COS34_05960 [Xanthomonadales bacterium CG02_land_8_20_14_3_00_62_12]
MSSFIRVLLLLATIGWCDLVNAQALRPGAAKPKVTVPVNPELEAKLAQTDNLPALLGLAANFESKGDFQSQVSVFNRVLELRPMAGNIRFELAAAYAQLNDKRNTYDLLLKLQTSGYAFDPSTDERFEKAHGTEAWDYIVLNLQANAKAFGEGKVAFTLVADDRLLETLAYDAKRQQFLLGSMRDGAVYRLGKDGKTLEPFITANAENQLRSVLAMQADNAHGQLWVTATGLPYFKGIDQNDYGKTALYQFDLASGKLLKRYELPIANGPHRFDYVHVSQQGRVYVADSTQKRIYQLEDAGLKLIMQNPKLSHVRGMASSDDGRILYFADTELGIFGIDLEQGKPLVISGPDTLTLFGIDGMVYWQGHLIVIQNAFPPSRVMRLKLDASGTRITSSMPLDAAQPEFAAPTHGVLVDAALYFIANSQLGQYDRYGSPINQSKLADVKIWKSDARFALNKTLDAQSIPITPAPAK